MPPTNPLPKELKQTAKNLYLQGINTTRISSELGLNIKTLNTWINRGNWKDQASDVLQYTQQANQKSLSVQMAEHSARIRMDLASEINRAVNTLKKIPNSIKDLPNRLNAIDSLSKSASKILSWDTGGAPVAPFDLSTVKTVKADQPPNSGKPTQQTLCESPKAITTSDD